ncbi:hypothetical protein P4U99_25165 [Brevibacillus agri]|uniref:hypothetical protein n=1 Tax=Brevibacillus TaxID=55080 RepID=UPI000422B48D|nr:MULTISPECIES: hypothetical protein [Brevibacillus]MBG9564379.1 hypothetical protein [Brevibacillus agri]MED1646410.1 hypothetical protein [Brevibacillus agri]MED1654844.1 hypothetical protein [Brevibacillus agri]MED1689391.1 hypothetical protein [Brevibacillus agri]MED1694395.1 hypothetical protein [Brevibacillus agri]
MENYLQYLNQFIAAIHDLPDRLAGVLASIQDPIRSLRNTLVATNILLGMLVVTSVANVYMLWRNGRKK